MCIWVLELLRAWVTCYVMLHNTLIKIVTLSIFETLSCGAVKLPAGKGDSFFTNWASQRRARQGRIAKMKMEMPRSFTDHPLSRKVEHLKSYAKILYIL